MDWLSFRFGTKIVQKKTHFQSRLYFQCFKPNLEVHRASFPVISQTNDNEISPGTCIGGPRSRRFWTSTRCRSWTWLASGCTNHSLGSSWSWPGSLTRASISCSDCRLSWPRKWPRDLCPIGSCPNDKLGPCLGRIRQLVTSCTNHNLEKCKQIVTSIAYSDQKFCDWDLKLLQATQHQGSHGRWFLKSPVVAALKRWFQHGGAVVIIAIRYSFSRKNKCVCVLAFPWKNWFHEKTRNFEWNSSEVLVRVLGQKVDLFLQNCNFSCFYARIWIFFQK